MQFLFVSTDLCSPRNSGMRHLLPSLLGSLQTSLQLAMAFRIRASGTCTLWIIKLISRLEISCAMLGTHNRFVSGGGSVSSLLSVSLFKLCRGTGRNWSVLAFRFAALPSPPIPRPPQTPTLAASPATVLS